MTRLYRLMLATAAVFGVPSAALADGPASGEVTGVSVQASPGRADIVINVRGAVEVRDFMLEGPNRLVLDVMGARLKGNASSLYDGVKRGGVLNVRYSQFERDVVRIVLELDHAKDYHVERGTDAIRVSFGTDQSFLAWSSNDPAPAAARVEVAASRARSSARRRPADPRHLRRAPDHGSVGPGQHRRRGCRLRRLQRSDHHPGQGHQG